MTAISLGVGAGDDRLRVAVEVEDEGCLGVPGRHDGVAPPVAALVVVDVPGDDGVVGVAGVVVLRVDLDAVAVRVEDVEVERVRDAVPAGAALDPVGAAQRAHLVADREDVVLLVGGERDVVHARAVAAGHRGVVDGGLAAHPGGVRRCPRRPGCPRSPGSRGPPCSRRPRGHVRGDLVEVVQADQLARGCRGRSARRGARRARSRGRTRTGSPSGSSTRTESPMPFDEALRAALDAAAELLVERDGRVEVLGRCAPGRRTRRRRRPGPCAARGCGG